MTGSAAILVLNSSSLKGRELEGIARRVASVFAARVTVVDRSLQLALAFDPSRRQSNSTALLAQVLEQAGSSADKHIAVVDVDLFIPILTFVYGEAQLGGTAAVVSTHRLNNPFYGLPRDDRRLFQRLEKEIIHELGHTYGLYHCRQFECVMRSSTYVEEIDMKRADPCPGCAALIGGAPAAAASQSG